MKKKLFISLFTIAVFGLLLFGYSILKNDMPEYEPQQNLSAPIEIPNNRVLSYEEAKKSEKPMLIMFYVDWCSYCRRYMPTFGEFANKYKDKYSFVTINCDNPEYKNMVKEFNILGFPTVFIVDKKFDLKFSVQMASMHYKSVMEEELDNYLKSREKMLQK